MDPDRRLSAGSGMRWCCGSRGHGVADRRADRGGGRSVRVAGVAFAILADSLPNARTLAHAQPVTRTDRVALAGADP